MALWGSVKAMLIRALLPTVMDAVSDFIQDKIAEYLTKENIGVYGDKFFDFLEGLVNKVDYEPVKQILLPAIAAARAALDVPDLPDED
jgi:hypothetical protein